MNAEQLVRKVTALTGFTRFAGVEVLAAEAGRVNLALEKKAELLQFNLSLPISTVVIGYDNMAVLEENIRTAVNFTAFDQGAMQKVRDKVAASQLKWKNFLQTHDDCMVA